MADFTWKDETSYSRSDKERKQNCWALYVVDKPKPDQRILTIVFGHLRFPGRFTFNCPTVGIENQILNTDSIELAKIDAIKVVLKELQRVSSVFVNAKLYAENELKQKIFDETNAYNPEGEEGIPER